jgi:hypothetical protein
VKEKKEKVREEGKRKIKKMVFNEVQSRVQMPNYSSHSTLTLQSAQLSQKTCNYLHLYNNLLLQCNAPSFYRV